MRKHLHKQSQAHSLISRDGFERLLALQFVTNKHYDDHYETPGTNTSDPHHTLLCSDASDRLLASTVCKQRFNSTVLKDVAKFKSLHADVSTDANLTTPRFPGMFLTDCL